MPTWLPPALGLVVFWGLLALLLRLLFRKSVPADPPFELSVGPDPADVRDMDHTELPGAEDISPRVREAWRALSAPPPRLEPELETALGTELVADRVPDPAAEVPATDPRLPFALRHRRLVAASRRLAAQQRGGDGRR